MEMFEGLLKKLEMRLKIGFCSNQESESGHSVLHSVYQVAELFQ